MPFPTGCLCYRRTYLPFLSPNTSTSSPEAPPTKSITTSMFTHTTRAQALMIALTKDVNTASSVFLIGTKALFNFNTEFPWGVVATGDTKYTCEYSPLEHRILV